MGPVAPVAPEPLAPEPLAPEPLAPEPLAPEPGPGLQDIVPPESVDCTIGCGGGNPFPAGQCTFHAYEMRSDIYDTAVSKGISPSGWDGYIWVERARQAGFRTGPTPEVGAIVSWSREGAATALGRQYGHVAYVTEVLPGGRRFRVTERNVRGPQVTQGLYDVTSRTTFAYRGTPGKTETTTPAVTPPSTPAPGSGNALNTVGMSGNWVGDPRYQDFAYVTKNASGGFAIAVWEAAPTGIQWRGVWLQDRALDFDQTTFIPADQDGDGRLDLYYVTRRPDGSGMDMALLRNTGSSFVYVGQQWNPGGLTPNNTQFLSGNFIGDPNYDDFAYVTKRAGGGFDIAVFESTLAGIQWRGVWLTDTQLPFEHTKFVPADQDGDGDLDLYYVVRRPDASGMDMALLTNTGSSFSYVGQQWNPNGLTPENTKFLVGNFAGDKAYDDFAYVTNASGGGFAIAVFESTPAGIQWRGVWLDDKVLNFATTSFTPVDYDGDGDLDLFYATRRSNGMDVALLANTGSSFSYIGQQWNPNNLFPETTKFLPQG